MCIIYLTENYGIFVLSKCYTEIYENVLEKIAPTKLATSLTKHSQSFRPLKRETSHLESPCSI